MNEFLATETHPGNRCDCWCDMPESQFLREYGIYFAKSISSSKPFGIIEFLF